MYDTQPSVMHPIYKPSPELVAVSVAHHCTYFIRAQTICRAGSYKLSSTTVSLDSPRLTLTSQISSPALICTCQLVRICQGDCSICGQAVKFTDDT